MKNSHCCIHVGRAAIYVGLAVALLIVLSSQSCAPPPQPQLAESLASETTQAVRK